MAKTMTDQQVLDAGPEIALLRLHAAADAQRLADEAAARPARRLSARARVRGALRQAGGNAAPIQALRNVLATRARQFPNLAGYVDGVREAIRQDEWRGGPPDEFWPAPTTWRADCVAAEREIGLTGTNANLWHAYALAVEDLAETSPHVFGDLDDPAEEERQRKEPQRRAAEALAAWRAVPLELMVGMAFTREIGLDPLGNLPERLVAHAMNPAPAPSPRGTAAPGSPSPAIGETVILGGTRFGA